MPKLTFDWRDEDPGALIVLVMAIVAVLFLPWGCDLDDSIGAPPNPNTPVQAPENPALRAP